MSGDPDLQHHLGTCLDRLQVGESVEDCLASYPAEAARLEPLLHLAAKMRAPHNVAMSPGGFEAGHARLLARADQLRVGQRQRTPAQGGIFLGLLAGTRRLALASMAGVLLLCGLVSTGTISVASASLPESPLYPVKRATEVIVSSLAPTPHLQMRIHLAWAERRVQELAVMAARQDGIDEALVAALDKETERALDAAEEAGPEALLAVVQQIEHQQSVLGQALEQASPAARSGLERALTVLRGGHARGRSALEQRPPPGPPITPPGQVENESPGGTAQETPPAVATPVTPTSTPGTADGRQPAGNGRGQDADPAGGQDTRYGQGQGQDRTTRDTRGDQGQSPGASQDELQPRGNGKGPPLGPAGGLGRGLDREKGKPEKQEPPGKNREKDK